MSTLEIAELTGKRHDNVLRDAYKMLEEFGFADLKFESSYKDSTGRSLRCLNLPKRECLVLVSGYSFELRARIIDRWLNRRGLSHGPPEDPNPYEDAERSNKR
jgi:phage regulator Rha-like protein